MNSFLIKIYTVIFIIYFSDNNDETEASFHVERFNSKKAKRIVKYNLINNHFSCSCYYTNFSGIICRHIFKVATQLNLEKLPEHLFFMRWRKDPSENVLVKKYRLFYNSNRELEINDENADNVREEYYEDYEYLLNRMWYKVQQIVKAKPETAKNFHNLLDKSVKDFYNSEKNLQIQNNGKIKNPESVKSKGNCFLNL